MPSSFEELSLQPLTPVVRVRSPFQAPLVRLRGWWRRVVSTTLQWVAAWVLLQVVAALELWTARLKDGKEE